MSHSCAKSVATIEPATIRGAALKSVTYSSLCGQPLPAAGKQCRYVNEKGGDYVNGRAKVDHQTFTFWSPNFSYRISAWKVKA